MIDRGSVGVVVTRPAGQAGPLADALGAAGLRPVLLPLLAIRDCHGAATDAGISALARAEFVVVTSENGAHRLGRPAVRGTIARDATLVAVGEATAGALASHGLNVALMPDEATGASIVEMLAGMGVTGRRIVLARAREGRPELATGLRDAGARVVELPLYESVDVTPDPAALAEAVAAPVWTLTSPRIVDGAVRVAGRDVLARASLVSIGPTTSARLRAVGLPVAHETPRSTVADLVRGALAVTGASPASPEGR